MGFSSGTAFATVCLMAMIYYNTLLFLIFAAMMLLACDRCLQKGVNNPVS
ncbi:hypothetical protein ACP3TB_02945 [Rahnella variigena]|nr:MULTISPECIES: hypothetical protein [Rahnella]TCQ84523.1 hypothetical protein EC840_11285 [Rahnella sp. JUb53]